MNLNAVWGRSLKRTSTAFRPQRMAMASEGYRHIWLLLCLRDVAFIAPGVALGEIAAATLQKSRLPNGIFSKRGMPLKFGVLLFLEPFLYID